MTDHAGDPFAAWANRTPLSDDEGDPLVVFTLTESTRGGRPWADAVWRPATAAVRETADAILAAMPGYALSTSDTELVSALTDAGATEIRHAHVMSHSLTSLPRVETDPALDIHPLSADQVARHAERLAEINVRAYPADHPDHEHDSVAAAEHEIRGMGLGEILGPFMGQSMVALVDGEIVGACLIVDREGVPPEGGPWIVEVFRDPDVGVKAVGRALIVSALTNCRAAGLPGLSLAVSHTNLNAFALYTELGFIDDNHSWTLALP